MQKVVCLFLLVCNLFLSFGQNNIESSTYVTDPKGSIRNHSVDFESLVLDVSFKPETGKVFGLAHYTFMPLQKKVDSLFLDGIEMTIHSITLDNKTTKYRVDSAGITIYFSPALSWETKHELSINYEAIPRKGIYFIGWRQPITASPNDPDRIRKQIWTQGQGVDNRFWIPSYDDVNDKLITALNITFDNKYEVISNGNLLNKIETANANTTTWRYAMDHPHALYLIMLAIGEYEHKDFVSKNGITSRQYYYPDKKDAVDATYKHSAEMMDWLQNEIGISYPWKTYANVPVQEFLYGAMENTTATIYTDYYFLDNRSSLDRSYEAINAHELTHQWFGDYVTEFSSTSHWLHESFATYYSKIFMRSIEGEDAYAWNRRTEMNSAINADNQNEFPVAHSQAGSSRHYQKGSYVLDMLRYVAGDEQFRKVIKEYLLAHPYQNVTTYDLEIQFMKTLGMNLHWFFDEWIYKSGYPVYDVSYKKDSQNITFNISQSQKKTETTGLFIMPIHLQVHYTNHTFIDTLIWIQDSLTTVLLPNKNANTISFTLFDPGHVLLSKVNFIKENSELINQAALAEHYIDRYDAVIAMKDIPLNIKRDVLLKVFNHESHFAIKSEIIRQLISDENKASVALIHAALHDKNSKVRQAVLINTDTINKKLRKDYEAALLDSSYQNIEIALRLLCSQYPEKKEKYLAATSTIYGSSKNVRIAWIEQYYSIDSKKYMKELGDYAGYSYEFRTRANAFDAIKAINFCDENVVRNLFDAATSSNYRLAGPARGTLQFLMKTPEYYFLIKKTFDETKWEDWQKARVELIFKTK